MEITFNPIFEKSSSFVYKSTTNSAKILSKYCFVLSILFLAILLSPQVAFSQACNPNDPGTLAGDDKIICKGSSVNIGCQNILGYCYSWSPLDGITPGTEKNSEAEVSPIITTQYTLIITNDDGEMIGQDAVTVTVVSADLQLFKPEVIAGNNTTMIPENNESNIGGMTFVNLDNDDEDGKFDIGNDASNKVNNGDDEFMRIKIKIEGAVAGNNTVKINALEGANFIKIWKSQDKSDGLYLLDANGIGEDLVLNAQAEAELWIEGIAPHTLQRQTRLSVTYNASPGIVCDDIVSLTIIGVASLAWEGIHNGFAPPAHSSDGLDTNDPNFVLAGGGAIQNSDMTPLLSYRVFSDAKADTGFGVPQDEVKLKVVLTVAPVEDLTMYIRAFDVDDPYTDPAPIGGNPRFIDPNDGGFAGTYSGTDINFTINDDNRGQVAGGGKFGAIVGDANMDGIAAIVFAANDIDNDDTRFHVSHHPGDNYRIAINGDVDFLEELRNEDEDDDLKIVDPHVPAEVLFPSNYLSHVLTVWRVLHVENDSMEDYVWGVNNVQQIVKTAENFTSPTNEGINLTELIFGTNLQLPIDFSLNLDSAPLRNGRFELGTLYIGGIQNVPGVGYLPSINSIQIGPGNIIQGNGNTRVVLSPGQSANIAGLPLTITKTDNTVVVGNLINVTKNAASNQFTWELQDIVVDNTFMNGKLRIDGSPFVFINDITLPNTVITNQFKITSIVRDDDIQNDLPFSSPLQGLDALLTAYIIYENDGGGGNNNNLDIPFQEHSFDPALHYPIIEGNRNSAMNETDFFWTVYVATCWQYVPAVDGDPNSENIVNGVYYGISGAGDIGITSHNVNLSSGSINSLIFRETMLDVVPPIPYEWVIIHEVGHQFGLSHGNFIQMGVTGPEIPEYPNVGIMSDGSHFPNMNANFIDRHINLIRSRVHSPGL